MELLELSANDLVARLLALVPEKGVCVLDSCGVGHQGSHLLIAGIRPVETIQVSSPDAATTLRLIDEKLSGDLTAIFTISYDFGSKLELPSKIGKQTISIEEPDLFAALFDSLVVHDYDSGATFVTGNASRFAEIKRTLSDASSKLSSHQLSGAGVTSNFSKDGYLRAIEVIKEHIRKGNTYQTNLTQQLTIELPSETKPPDIFQKLRTNHPAPFAAYIDRGDSTVISASPERFFCVRSNRIEAAPIKGTRPRRVTPEDDEVMRAELLASEKDRAENTMIVDLLRNDLGRVCSFGSVTVDKLCELEEHPTLFHLVSTIHGELRPNTTPSEMIRSLFPCGSITGAPKIRTMQIIDEIETERRGLSMGAIGYYIPQKGFELPAGLDLSVAIRTMVVRGQTAVFNVGGGIVIDSDPEAEYEESLLKAKALLDASGASVEDLRELVHRSSGSNH